MNHVYHQLIGDIDNARVHKGGYPPEDRMCNETQFICRCDEWFEDYDQLEDHIVSHANLGNDGHWYFAKCVGPNCRIVHV